MPQDALLFPNLDVKGNIDDTAAEEESDFDSWSRFSISRRCSIDECRMLSGGEKRRVAIARALMTRPSILLLDEPLAGVDRDRRELILPYILRIRRELHVPLIYVTHDEAELNSIADRVLRLGG